MYKTRKREIMRKRKRERKNWGMCLVKDSKKTSDLCNGHKDSRI